VGAFERQVGAIRIRHRLQAYQEPSGATNRTRCPSHFRTPGLCGSCARPRSR